MKKKKRKKEKREPAEAKNSPPDCQVVRLPKLPDES
jgi:hypothetical protein